jgi:Glycosyltransferase Family 4
MTPLRILLTNHTLGDRGGSDLYVRDVATALLARGHRPLVYSPVLGTVADDLRIATVPVVDDLDEVAEAPDVIHGQHHLETMTALLHFPGVPAVFCCHGWLPWEETPPLFPRVRRYVAVDEVCRDRLTCQHGIPAGQTSVLLNFVDLDRFQPRAPLPARPARALLFCNEDGPHVAVVRAACARAGIALDVVGRAFGNASPAPESLLGQYDLVFARARSALEAAAVGSAVILISALGLGPMVTAGELDRLRRQNLGIRALSAPLTVAGVLAAIDRYDPVDARDVCLAVRASAGRDAVVDAWLAIYAGLLEAPRAATAAAADEESRAAARYLRTLTGPLKWPVLERAALQRRVDAAEASTDHLREQVAAAFGERTEILTGLEHARATIRNMERSRFWKARAGWLRWRERFTPEA